MPVMVTATLSQLLVSNTNCFFPEGPIITITSGVSWGTSDPVFCIASLTDVMHEHARCRATRSNC